MELTRRSYPLIAENLLRICPLCILRARGWSGVDARSLYHVATY
jgi:hypothetical protein